MTTEPTQKEGLRERKRRETQRRIADTGLRLFLACGFEETTLDMIAEAADISRRTFFYYFRSKEEILLTWQSNLGEALGGLIREDAAERGPMAVVLAAILRLAESFDADEHVALERLLSSTEQLRASKQAKYVEQEKAVYEVLCERWPDPERRFGLRLVAMASIGALRVAADQWIEDGGEKPLIGYLVAACPSSNDLRRFGLWKNGVSGSVSGLI